MLASAQPKRPLATIGPASSGPNKDAQRVHCLPSFYTAQLSYSASSPDLSDHSVFKTFLRTAVSDLYQANFVSMACAPACLRTRLPAPACGPVTVAATSPLLSTALRCYRAL